MAQCMMWTGKPNPSLFTSTYTHTYGEDGGERAWLFPSADRSRATPCPCYIAQRSTVDAAQKNDCNIFNELRTTDELSATMRKEVVAFWPHRSFERKSSLLFSLSVADEQASQSGAASSCCLIHPD